MPNPSDLETRVRLGLYYIEELDLLPQYKKVEYLRNRRRFIRQRLLSKTPLDPRLWPDYQLVMQTDLRKRAEEILSPLLKQWDRLLLEIPEIQTLYSWELQARDKPHTTNETRKKQRARLAALRKAARDMRILGKLEVFMEGKTLYGYDTNYTRY